MIGRGDNDEITKSGSVSYLRENNENHAYKYIPIKQLLTNPFKNVRMKSGNNLVNKIHLVHNLFLV
jgi:hypothetical protein